MVHMVLDVWPCVSGTAYAVDDDGSIHSVCVFRQAIQGDRGKPYKATACDPNRDKHSLFVH